MLARCCTGKFIPNLQQRHLAPFLFQGISYVISLRFFGKNPVALAKTKSTHPLEYFSAIYKRDVGRTRRICAWIVALFAREPRR